MTPDLCILGGTVLTMDPAGRALENAVIQIGGGKILSVTSDPAFRAPSGVRVLDASGCLVMPGLVNGHTHTFLLTPLGAQIVGQQAVAS